FEKALSEIRSKAYYQLTDDEIYQAALTGVLDKIEQKSKNENASLPIAKANVILPPKTINSLSNEIKGEISGIGVGIQYDKNKGQTYPVLIDIIKGGGAEKANLQVNDQVLKIDGRPISEFKSFEDIVYAIRGKAGSTLRLRLLRDGETFDRKVERKIIQWNAFEVSSSPNGTPIFRINYFNEKTVPAMKKAIHSLKSKKVILDLRQSRGGLFKEGLDAIKLFAAKGTELLRIEHKDGKIETHTAQSDGPAKDLNVALLVGGETKSMGEAFAAAIANLRQAKLIGAPTFGKGTVETMMTLDNHYSVKFTVSKLYDAQGKTWDRVGLTPSIQLPQTEGSPSETDPHIQLAQLILNTK
ncbi:MAG: hypothetical protein CL675_06770, partial [Bdellovibrionaceae bacterium]|nr:hypothetical protein [Pseudobdellovibrionaceae bacterium]